MSGAKFGEYATDVVDAAVKGGDAWEGLSDQGIRLILPNGTRILVSKIREGLDRVKIPAENAAGEPYEAPLRLILASLLTETAT